MSNRRAQDERIEGTPDGSNAISEIVDVPDAPTIGTATAGMVSASITFTPATTGGTASLYTATSTPGSVTGTSATSPITVSGLNSGTSYTFKVKGSNSTGTGAESSASNSITPTPPIEGAYDALAVVTLSSSASSVTFNSIPSGYKHLQIRAVHRNAGTGTQGFTGQRLNNDSTSSYSIHQITGTGASTPVVVGAASQTGILWNSGTFYYNSFSSSATANCFAVSVYDYLDYANTSKNKAIRAIEGHEMSNNDGNSRVQTLSAMFMRVAAISAISFSCWDENGTASSFIAGSKFALYGVK